MSDPKEPTIRPTIRLSTCRGTGCPECGRDVPYSGGLLPTLCECRVCSSGCFSQHERRLLMEALRQRDALLVEVGEALGLLGCNGAPLPERVRQRMADLALRTRERDEAKRRIAFWEGYGEPGDGWCGEHKIRFQADARDFDDGGDECQICRAEKAERERDEAIRERDLARTHDAQPYPTAEAYERVCAALEAAKRSLEQTRAAMEAGDACTVCAGTGKPVSGKPCICGGHGGIGNQIIGLTREVQWERERADRAEALLRDVIAENVWVSAPLLAKIREVVR